MLFRQVLHEDLGCASYVIADGGEGVVVDPIWEIEAYVALAEEQDLTYSHILETHTHADHVSGRSRLARATGGVHAQLRDGDVLDVGRARIAALATPGHRPEHLAFVVSDRSRSGEPWLILTGDSLFVADLARPDLAVDPEDGARGLFRSVRKLLELADDVEVWPGHVGGSLCGGGETSEKPSSTIGYERRFNRYLAFEDENEFVRELTAAPPPQPPNFERIVELNREGPPSEAAVLDPLAPPRLRDLLEDGAILIDARDVREFDGIHIPGSINVTATRTAVGTRAAWVVEPDAPVAVAAPSDEEARRAARLLEAVGFRRLLGYLAGGIPAWEAAGLPVEATEAIDPPALAERLRAGRVRLLDVREDAEWEEGHVEGSLHVPYHELRDGPPAELRGDGQPLAVACSAGNRSSIAASLLRRAGLSEIQHVVAGGVEDLERYGVDLVKG